jgi:hypothetical protein
MRIENIGKNKIITLVASSLAGLIAAKLASHAVQKYFDHKNDITSNASLGKMVSQMGLTLPMMIDSETELYSILGADKTIRYFYRLVNLPFQKISAEDIEKIKPKMINFNCTTPETKNGVLKRGIKMRYSYYDKDKVHIADIEITPSDCGF